MTSITSSSPFSISIVSILVEAERLQTSYEIARAVAELSIFEHIDLPYMTGTLLISDSSNLLEEINFQGSERVTITLKIDGDPTSTQVKKEFIISSIIGVAPSGDTSETISLSLHESHAYLDNVISVSKAYEGSSEKIISDILQDNLGIEYDTPETLDKRTTWSKTVQPEMKVIIPSITPLNACRWIKDKMSNSNGSPFFLYSCLNNDKLILTNLDTIISNPVNNTNQPYVYSQAYVRETNLSSVTDQAYTISEYKLGKSSDMFSLFQNGAIGSRYNFVDINVGSDVETVSIKSNIDTSFKVGDKNISDIASHDITQIGASHTYTDFANYYEHSNIAHAQLSAVSSSLRRILVKDPVDMVVPGWNFLGRGDNIGVGSKIKCQFLKNDPEIYTSGKQGGIDETRSGDYLIYALRHVIRQEIYEVSLTGVKV